MLVEVVGRWSWIIIVRWDVRCKRADSASVPMVHYTLWQLVWIIVVCRYVDHFLSSCSADSIVAILRWLGWVYLASSRVESLCDVLPVTMIYWDSSSYISALVLDRAVCRCFYDHFDVEEWKWMFRLDISWKLCCICLASFGLRRCQVTKNRLHRPKHDWTPEKGGRYIPCIKEQDHVLHIAKIGMGMPVSSFVRWWLIRNTNPTNPKSANMFSNSLFQARSIWIHTGTSIKIRRESASKKKPTDIVSRLLLDHKAPDSAINTALKKPRQAPSLKASKVPLSTSPKPQKIHLQLPRLPK
jgi:hypothetical protein